MNNSTNIIKCKVSFVRPIIILPAQLSCVNCEMINIYNGDHSFREFIMNKQYDFLTHWVATKLEFISNDNTMENMVKMCQTIQNTFHTYILQLYGTHSYDDSDENHTRKVTHFFDVKEKMNDLCFYDTDIIPINYIGPNQFSIQYNVTNYGIDNKLYLKEIQYNRKKGIVKQIENETKRVFKKMRII